MSSALPSPQDAEFLRNLARTKSFSQNPRFKKHSSLDTGVRRQSRLSSYADYYDGGESECSSSKDDEKRLLHDFGAQFYPLSPRGHRGRGEHAAVQAKVALAIVLIFAAGLLGGVFLINRSDAEDWFGVRTTLEDYGVAFKQSTCENPYAEYGHLAADQKKPENNRWVPYDTTCTPPPLMAALRSTAEPTKSSDTLQLPLPARHPVRNDSLPLPWLHGKTVLLYGDHLERLHNKDFCRFAGGKFASIGADHPLSPPRFVNGIDERLPGANHTFDNSRPSVCYVEQYDFMVVSVFHFGLANRVEFEQESLYFDEHFYPPVAVNDRLSHIVLPLLSALHRPKLDLIEFSSGFWDLRHFTALDEQANLDPFSDLTSDRLDWYQSRLTATFHELASTFPHVPLLWRALHQTPKFANTPFSRVAALDQLSRKVVKDLNLARRKSAAAGKSADASRASRIKAALRPRPGHKDDGSGGEDNVEFLDRVKGRIGKEAKKRMEQVRLSRAGQEQQPSSGELLKGMIRVDEWGSLMLGQQHLMDKVHTPPLPGGYLWGDMMLFELRRVVLGSSSSWRR